MIAIQTKNLTKKFGDLVAVDSVTLEIEEGECFGLLGPNGAGKTSLIRMITAVSPPTGGEVRVFGENVKEHARDIKARLGVVPQHDNLDPDLTVLQNLLTFARYFDIPKVEALRRSQEVLQLFELESKANSHMKELSGGMKRRLLIARGLINQPRIIVLDEPTIGLDPQAKYLVWHKLAELKSQGITELMCTQNMEEAAALCNRVAIMHLGKILGLGSPPELISRYVGKEMGEAEIDGSGREELVRGLQNRGADFEVDSNRIHVFHIESCPALRELKEFWEKLRRRPGSLEDVFFRITGRTLIE
ncbi:MAG: ABC transporter ATP-binding protein [Chloroflexota bacterium]